MCNIPTNRLVEKCSILGIDPGSTNLGIAILNFELFSKEIISTEAFTINADRLVLNNSWLSENYDNKTARITALREKLLYILDYYDPVAIACESPFYNPKRPQAYGVLVEVLAMIRSVVIEHDDWKKLHMIDPSSVKQAVGAPGNANKETMAYHIGRMNQLNILRECVLDEHSVDATAVAYCKYIRLVKNEVAHV